MILPCVSSDYLDRAERLRKRGDAPSLVYATLELRCGIEARMEEYAAHAIGISKAKAQEWEIKKLGKTLDTAFGLGDTMLVILVKLSSGESGQFMYAPVTARLQAIGKKCGDYLHVSQLDPTVEESHWAQLRSMLHEGCGLLRLACAGEVLRPSFGDGLHIALEPDDPRVQLVQSLKAGVEAQLSVFNITPTGPITYYPADQA